MNHSRKRKENDDFASAIIIQDNHVRMMQVKEYSDAHLKKDVMIPVLKISDYNTTGLTGVDNTDDINSCWYGLVKSSSSTNKSDESSGSQGVGKFVAYTFTKLRTVLYSTCTEDGKKGFQGKTILVTFRDENNKKRVNKARFGRPVEEDVEPVRDYEDIPYVFRRDKPGTDIYIIGFEKDDDWLQQMAMSVIEFFFYAIYKGTLEVILQDGKERLYFEKNNIGQQIAKYDEYYQKSDYIDDENFQYTAPVYWQAITDHSENHFHIKKPFSYRRKNMGLYELYLMMGPHVKEKRVLEMRKAGMKIREDTRFRIQPSFVGVFIATGAEAASSNPEDNISSFLRRCENPSHDAWSAANYPEEKNKAKGIIDNIHKIIIDEVKSRLPKDDSAEVKAYGLNELLISQGNGSAESENEEAFLTARPEPIQVTLNDHKNSAKKDISKKSNGRGMNTKGKKKTNTSSTKEHRNNKNGHKRKTVSSIPLLSVKTPFDEERGIYRIVFKSQQEVSNIRMAIDVIGDDGDSEAADIVDAKMCDISLDIKEDCVIIPDIRAEEKTVIEIKLRGNRRERLEVSAYGEL